MNIELNLEILNFKNSLKKAKNILLINHRRMDGDCFGSLSAFYYILLSLGYNLTVINDEKTPEIFKFLNQEEIFNAKDIKNNFDLIISFDSASLQQLGDSYIKNIEIFNNTTFVNIDHHISNTLFGNINIIDINACSTCEIIWNIINEFGYLDKVNSKIATFLLTGLITDTNNFINTNVSSSSFLMASSLMYYKPNHQEIIINLFKRKSLNKIALWGKLLDTLKNIDNKIIWNTVSLETFRDKNTTNKDISGLVDEFFMSIDGVEIGFILYEIDINKVKGSFRAKTDILDLNLFCSKWGGGGHKRASGFIIEGKTLTEVESEIKKELKNIF